MQGGILVLDIFFTGLLGVIVDAATGAWYKLEPTTAVVTLTQSAPGPGPETIDVHLRSEADEVHVESSAPSVEVQVTKR